MCRDASTEAGEQVVFGKTLREQGSKLFFGRPRASRGDDLDEFEQAVLRTAIDNLKEIKREIEELMKG